MTQYFELQNILFDLEAQLRQLNMWDETSPTAEQLASTMPFCVDTLEFRQWLQFILIPAAYGLIEQEASLSIGAQIHPMAEEALAKTPQMQSLLNCIEKLDQILA